MVKLYCWCEDGNQGVDFNDIDANTLKLWKVTIERSRLQFLLEYPKIVTATKSLNPIDPLSTGLKDPLPDDHINIIIVKRPTLPDNNGSIVDELELLRTHFWGENRVRQHLTAEIIDLSSVNFSQLNPLFINVLLVREEYRIAYDAIIAKTIVKAGRIIILLTGQPGIGKTFFLLYFLFRQLQERKIVALQISANEFVVFDQSGVRLCSTAAAETFSIPKGIWTLSDSYGKQQPEPCIPFQSSRAHLLHTSSPSSHRWKQWVKQLSAHMYIMGVWSREEFRTLLTLSGLSSERERGLTLFDLYGSNIRICIDILKEPEKEETHLRHVQVSATKFARDSSKSFQELLELDFGSKDVLSKIFTLRPENLDSRHLPALTILTPFLLKTFAVALSRDAAAQHVVFAMLNSHPSLRASAGNMFENMAHVFAADPKRSELHITTRTKKSTIPAPEAMISGNDSLKHIVSPFHFYWRPREPNFKGVDAVIRHGYHVWALQYTVSRAHRAATDGLTEVHKTMNHKSGVTWHLVMVGSTRQEAESARNTQKLTGAWAKIPVYACIMEFGIFDEQKLQQLGELFENVSKVISCEYIRLT